MKLVQRFLEASFTQPSKNSLIDIISDSAELGGNSRNEVGLIIPSVGGDVGAEPWSGTQTGSGADSPAPAGPWVCGPPASLPPRTPFPRT